MPNRASGIRGIPGRNAYSIAVETSQPRPLVLNSYNDWQRIKNKKCGVGSCFCPRMCRTLHLYGTCLLGAIQPYRLRIWSLSLTLSEDTVSTYRYVAAEVKKAELAASHLTLPHVSCLMSLASCLRPRAACFISHRYRSPTSPQGWITHTTTKARPRNQETNKPTNKENERAPYLLISLSACARVLMSRSSHVNDSTMHWQHHLTWIVIVCPA